MAFVSTEVRPRCVLVIASQHGRIGRWLFGGNVCPQVTPECSETGHPCPRHHVPADLGFEIERGLERELDAARIVNDARRAGK